MEGGSVFRHKKMEEKNRKERRTYDANIENKNRERRGGDFQRFMIGVRAKTFWRAGQVIRITHICVCVVDTAHERIQSEYITVNKTIIILRCDKRTAIY